MAGKREYSGATLTARSRWQDVWASYPPTQRDAVVARVDELIDEHREYCDDGNFSHMANLLTGLALYEWYLAQGSTEDEAYRLVAEPMWAYVEKGAGLYRTLVRIPGFFGLFARLLPRMFEAGSGYGWEHVWHETSSRRIRFDEAGCVYAQILEAHGCRQMGCMFCHADIINYGQLPGATFTRHHTLCEDGQPCDFLIERQ